MSLLAVEIRVWIVTTASLSLPNPAHQETRDLQDKPRACTASVLTRAVHQARGQELVSPRVRALFQDLGGPEGQPALHTPRQCRSGSGILRSSCCRRPA